VIYGFDVWNDMRDFTFGAQALAQDQLRALVELLGEKSNSIGLGVYDGDTNQDLRLRFRDSARLVRYSMYKFESFYLHSPVWIAVGILSENMGWVSRMYLSLLPFSSNRSTTLTNLVAPI